MVLQSQQKELESQRTLLPAQGESIERLQAALDDVLVPVETAKMSSYSPLASAMVAH